MVKHLYDTYWEVTTPRGTYGVNVPADLSDDEAKAYCENLEGNL